MLTHAFFLGFCSCLLQLLVLRELMAALGGNELVYIFCLCGWMTGVACGSLWLKCSAPLLFGLSAFFAPLTLLGAASVRLVIGLLPGQIPDLFVSALVSFLLVLPASVVFGAVFPALAREGKESLMSLYAQEALGFVAAGAGATFLFFPFMRNWHIVALVCLSLLSICLRSGGSLFFRVLVTVVALFFFVAGKGEEFYARVRDASWKGFRMVAQQDTVYGRSLLLERDGSWSFFENGRFCAAKDTALIEELVHYPLLAHPAPGRLLILGGTLAAGREPEALKYPGLSVDRTELDTRTAAFLAREMSSVRQALQSPRLRVLRTDGRAYLKRVRSFYDVIIVDAGEAQTLLQNRFYTREFFAEVFSSLADGGVLALTVASPGNYMNEEGRRVLRILATTLRAVFPEVLFLPGERTLLLGVRSSGTITLDPRELEKRLLARGVSTNLVRPGYWDERFDRWRRDQLEDLLAVPGEINCDLRPELFVFSLSFWSTHFNSWFARFIQAAERGWPFLWVLAFGIFLLASRSRVPPSSLTAAAGGFQLMIIKAVILIVFQALFGYIYSWFGLITAVFMAGVWAGAWFVHRSRMFVMWQALFLAAVVPLAGALVLPFLGRCASGWFSMSVLFLFAFIAGAVSGGQFAVAVFTGKQARKLYAADVFGSILGFVLGGVVLVPLRGGQEALLLCAVVQLGLLTAFIRQDRWSCGKTAPL